MKYNNKDKEQNEKSEVPLNNEGDKKGIFMNPKDEVQELENEYTIPNANLLDHAKSYNISDKLERDNIAITKIEEDFGLSNKIKDEVKGRDLNTDYKLEKSKAFPSNFKADSTKKSEEKNNNSVKDDVPEAESNLEKEINDLLREA